VWVLIAVELLVATMAIVLAEKWVLISAFSLVALSVFSRVVWSDADLD